MTVELEALRIDTAEPDALAAFWAGVLGWQVERAADGGIDLVPHDDTGFRLRFLESAVRKVGPNQMHFDLTSGTSEQQAETVARALALGGRHIDVGQLPEEEHVVLADPEGNEFCVIEAGNSFLADCGFIGALSSDGTRHLGHFWSDALGWPLVWDQDEETAIRSPHGGPKISWGGPPLAVRSGRNRWRYELAPSPGSDVRTEVERLASFGATRLGPVDGEPDGVALLDTDGNEFCVVPR